MAYKKGYGKNRELYNRNIENPLTIEFFLPEKNARGFYDFDKNYFYDEEGTLHLSALCDYRLVKEVIKKHATDKKCDGVIVQKNFKDNEPNIARQLEIRLRAIHSALYYQNVAILNNYNGKNYFLVNPEKYHDDVIKYAPSDEIVEGKYNAYQTPEEWGKHQASVWNKMRGMYPLGSERLRSNMKHDKVVDHYKVLTAKNRGLEDKDIQEFWSWKRGRVVCPLLIDDNCVGMPGFDAYVHSGFKIKGKEAMVFHIETIGMEGALIPMKNVYGDVTKYQVCTDGSKYNVCLKSRAADGITIKSSEFYDKESEEYLFKNKDGQYMHLRVQDLADLDGKEIEFSDRDGNFVVTMGQDIKQVLEDRGYAIPSLMDSIKVAPKAKYIWQSPGSMCGSENVMRKVAPSNAGFIVAREPAKTNEKQDYIVVVAEGALKGHIVAKYMNHKDKVGRSMGDFLAKDSGIIIAQVPGVAKSFIESVVPVYDRYNVKGTYIAMDADGKKNLMVARGISQAEEILQEHSPVKVMSWNPEYKGLDDFLLGVSRHEMTLADGEIHFGKAEKLFPLEEAEMPKPYNLDGTRGYGSSWRQEYEEAKRLRNKGFRILQDGSMEWVGLNEAFDETTDKDFLEAQAIFEEGFKVLPDGSMMWVGDEASDSQEVVSALSEEKLEQLAEEIRSEGLENTTMSFEESVAEVQEKTEADWDQILNEYMSSL